MKHTRIWITTSLLAALLALPAAALARESVEVALRAAMETETVEGDLKGAIEQYRKIAEGSDRAIAAKALIRMAGCYEKLGDTESRKIYERVLREYADQTEAAALARARLGGAERAERQRGMALRKVWAGDLSGRISSDGRYISHVDWDSLSWNDWGTLLLHDLVAGTDRPLSPKSETKGSAFNSAISRDGMRVAYAWCGGPGPSCELRLSSLHGEGVPPHQKLFASEEIVITAPRDWSPDGKWIAVRVRRKDRTTQIGLVGVQDGSLRVLKTVNWAFNSRIFFSPDGKDLAFDLPASETGDQHDVFVLAADGSREVPAVVHASNDIVMGWSPDGKHLLFASDRNGSIGLWALAFENRKPQGPPKLIKANIGSAKSMGVTNDGSLYLGVATTFREIEEVSIDLDTGKQVGPPSRPIQTFVGTNMNPAWSRDGKYLAYVSTRGPNRDFIGIRSVDTAEVRELHPQPSLGYLQGPSWAPDGRSLVASGTGPKGRHGIFRIDAQTGEVVPIVAPTPERLSYEGFFWSPDGKRMYYHSQKGAIYEREVASGKTREVIRGRLGPISLSPDGLWIATTEKDESERSTAVVLIPVEGGEPRELLHVSEPQWINNTSMPWTPDGRGILVRKMLVAGGKKSELWLVPIDGGPARKLDFDANRVARYAPGKIRLHPDGRRLAYVFGDYTSEVWVLENFLPALSAKK